MRLETKGEIRLPPRLKGPAQSVSLEIQSWQGVIAATHWFLNDRTQVDGVDFYVGDKELGHIHLDGELHLRVTVGLRRLLIDCGRAYPFRWADDWVQAPIATRLDARNALWLFQIGYDRLIRVPISDLRRRVRKPVG